MSTKSGDGPVTDSEMSCEFLSEWGRCAQRRQQDNWCSYHYNALNLEGFRHDDAYHRKIVAGLLEPSHDVLSPKASPTGDSPRSSATTPL